MSSTPKLKVQGLKNKAHNLANDETLPIINKSQHPKKGDYKGKKIGRTHVQEHKRTSKRGQTTREHQVPKCPHVMISISNSDRGGPHERRPSLEKPSPTTTSCFKIETA